MEIGDSTTSVDELYEEIRRLGLERNVAELDSFGYTIVEPEKVAPPEFARRLRDRVLDVVESRSGVRPDLETGSTHSDLAHGLAKGHYWLLFEDRVFEEALLNPVALALATYLVGEKCVLGDIEALLKGPGSTPLRLHADNGGVGIPSPYPSYSQVCNVTWVLTDYSKENGALCFVPGSHRRRREPTEAESSNLERAVPIEAAAGSLVVWGGEEWHAAFPRTAAGLRVSLFYGYLRPHLHLIQTFRDGVTKEILDRNPPRFATLMGRHQWHFDADGNISNEDSLWRIRASG